MTLAAARRDRVWQSYRGGGRLSSVASAESGMAIKRSMKSRGTTSHKPIASAPLRHVDVRTVLQMVAGELYVGWLCKNRACGRVIAIAPTAPGKALTDFDDQLTAIKCPHCGDENLYRWSARSEQPYAPSTAGT